MKKLFTTLIFTSLITGLMAQAPNLFSFQAVVRDNSNQLIVNSPVGMKTSIRMGSPTGTVVYEELHFPNPQTNDNGLVTIQIGSGLPLQGSFANIQLDQGPYYITTDTDPTGGTNYTISGTSQFLSVPYALYANKSGEANPVGQAGGDLTGSFPNPVIANNAITAAKIANNAVTTTKIANDAITTAKIANSAVTEGKIANGSVSAVKLSSMGAANGNLLGYNGTNWTPVAKNTVSPWNMKANGDIDFPNGRAFIGASWGNLPSNYNLGVIDTTETFIVVGGTTFNTGKNGGIAFTEGYNISGSCGFELYVDGNAFGNSGLILVGGCPIKNDTIFEASREGNIIFRDQVVIDANSIGSITFPNNGADFYINHRNITGTTLTDHRRKGIMLKNKNSSTNRWNIYTSAAGALEIYYNGTLRGSFSSSNGVYTSSSDHRLKREVQPMQPALEAIVNIPVISYKYIFHKEEDDNNYDDTRRNLGVMANDVQKYFPELVYTTTSIPSEFGIEDETLMLDYAGLSVVAIKAIQEQQEIIEAQNEKIAALEQKVNELLMHVKTTSAKAEIN